MLFQTPRIRCFSWYSRITISHCSLKYRLRTRTMIHDTVVLEAQHLSATQTGQTEDKTRTTFPKTIWMKSNAC